jgi:hypothetical protein
VQLAAIERVRAEPDAECVQHGIARRIRLRDRTEIPAQKPISSRNKIVLMVKAS